MYQVMAVNKSGPVSPSSTIYNRKIVRKVVFTTYSTKLLNVISAQLQRFSEATSASTGDLLGGAGLFRQGVEHITWLVV